MAPPTRLPLTITTIQPTSDNNRPVATEGELLRRGETIRSTISVLLQAILLATKEDQLNSDELLRRQDELLRRRGEWKGVARALYSKQQIGGMLQERTLENGVVRRLV
jgi:hypothetical protein